MLETGAINFAFQPKWPANGPGTELAGPHARPTTPSYLHMSTTCDETNHGPHKSDACGRDDVGEGGSDGTLAGPGSSFLNHSRRKGGAGESLGNIQTSHRHTAI